MSRLILPRGARISVPEEDVARIGFGVAAPHMLKSLRVDIPHVGALLPAIGLVRHPLSNMCA